MHSSKFRLAVLSSAPNYIHSALYRNLARQEDFDVTVYLCSDSTSGQMIGYDQVVDWGVDPLEGYNHVSMKNYGLTKSAYLRYLNPGIISALVAKRYDALFVDDYSQATKTVAALVARLTRTKVLFLSSNHMKIDKQLSSSRKFIKKLILPTYFRLADFCMANGSWNKEYYQYFGVPERKIIIMPYAVDNQFFFDQSQKLATERQKIKDNLGIISNKVILYVGRFLPRKRVIDLIQAFEKLGMAGVALILVGTGSELAVCQQYVREHNVHQVHFMGFVSQVKISSLYAISDVFVLPTDEEQWGLVVNEAMCFGLPIIVSDTVGAGADLVKNAQNGYVFRTGDFIELSRLLRLTLEDGAKEMMGRKSLEIIQNWNVEEDIKILRKVLNR